VTQGTGLSKLARAGEYVKIDLGSGRFGFVSAKEVADGGTASSAPAFDDLYSHAPPMIDVAPAALATRDGHIKIGATATDVTKLLDTYIFVGSRKCSIEATAAARTRKRCPSMRTCRSGGDQHHQRLRARIARYDVEKDDRRPPRRSDRRSSAHSDDRGLAMGVEGRRRRGIAVA